MISWYLGRYEPYLFFVGLVLDFEELSSPSVSPIPVALLPALAAPFTAPFAAPTAAPTTTALIAFFAFFKMPGEERFLPLDLAERFFDDEADFLLPAFLLVFLAAMATPL